MDNAKRDLIRDWLTKALHDLQAARLVTSSDTPLLDVGGFHCQQAAEKAIKAYLAFKDHPFPKTHDLGNLLDRASQKEPRFQEWMERIAGLSDYATGMRYPGYMLTLTAEEYRQAESAAADFYAFVCSLLPVETHPDT
ncbi:MAG: HEPN domain-containing protein [Phycisphaerae bacterium]